MKFNESFLAAYIFNIRYVLNVSKNIYVLFYIVHQFYNFTFAA